MKYLLSTLLLFAAFASNAQNENIAYVSGGYMDGYVILKDGTQKNGFIRYSDPYNIQNTVVFFTDKDDKDTKEKFDAEDLTEYRVGEKTYHVIHWSGGMFDKPLKGNMLVEDGCIRRYTWYNRPESVLAAVQNPGESDADFLERKYSPQTVYNHVGKEKAYQQSDFGLKFAKKMSEFVEDNAELAEKVANKEKGYKMLNMLSIIEEYNENCEM